MATLVVKKVVLTGLNPLDPAYVAATAGGDDVPNSGSLFLHFVNGATQETTVTINSIKACSQGFDHDAVVVCPVNAERMIGPFDRGRFNDASGSIDITYAGGVVNLTVAAIEVSP